MGKPSRIHEQRTCTLDAMATLRGFTYCFRRGFPDGARPDVLRGAPGLHTVFIGEAKATEAATTETVQIRLSRYLAWFRACSRG